MIPRCVIRLSEESVLPIFNDSDEPVKYAKDTVVARGLTCTSQHIQSCDVLTTSAVSMPPLTLEDIKVNKDIGQKEKEKLLNMVNLHRGCSQQTLVSLVKVPAPRCLYS